MYTITAKSDLIYAYTRTAYCECLTPCLFGKALTSLRCLVQESNVDMRAALSYMKQRILQLVLWEPRTFYSVVVYNVNDKYIFSCIIIFFTKLNG